MQSSKVAIPAQLRGGQKRDQSTTFMQTRDERARLVEYCREHGITLSDFIRETLTEALDARICLCGDKGCRYAYSA